MFRYHKLKVTSLYVTLFWWQNVIPDANENDTTLIKLLSTDEWEIDNTQVVMPELRPIGKGNFWGVQRDFSWK